MLVKGVNSFARSFADKISKAAIFTSFYTFAPLWCASTSSWATRMRDTDEQTAHPAPLLLTLRGFNHKT